MDTDKGGRDRITQQVIGCAFEVSNQLGYKGVTIGEYTADLLVERSVLVEWKAVKALDDLHRAQCLNYLKATGLELLEGDWPARMPAAEFRQAAARGEASYATGRRAPYPRPSVVPISRPLPGAPPSATHPPLIARPGL